MRLKVWTRPGGQGYEIFEADMLIVSSNREMVTLINHKDVNKPPVMHFAVDQIVLITPSDLSDPSNPPIKQILELVYPPRHQIIGSD